MTEIVDGIGVETDIPRGKWPIAAAFTFRVLVTEDGNPASNPVNTLNNTYQLVVRYGTTLLFKKDIAATGNRANVNGTNDALDFPIAIVDTENANEGWHEWAVWRTDGTNDRPVSWGRVFLTKVALQEVTP